MVYYASYDILVFYERWRCLWLYWLGIKRGCGAGPASLVFHRRRIDRRSGCLARLDYKRNVLWRLQLEHHREPDLQPRADPVAET